MGSLVRAQEKELERPFQFPEWFFAFGKIARLTKSCQGAERDAEFFRSASNIGFFDLAYGVSFLV